MDLQSPQLLATAWIVAPALVALAAAGLGLGLGRLSGLALGALTLPAGFLAGICAMAFALEVGAPGRWAVVLCAVLAVAGAASGLVGRPPRLPRPPAFLWAAAAALGAFGIGLAPLAGSGRSGVLGYVLNNDTSVHLAAVALLRDSGTAVVDEGASSFHMVSTLFGAGYPIGSHAWPLFASEVARLDAFHVWSPLIAVAAGLMALVAYTILRQLAAGPPLAAAAALVIASGYLPYSYLAQGGAKEVVLALTVYATVALFTLALHGASGLLAWVPAAVGVAAGVHVLGLGAGAWLGPAALVGAALVPWRPPAALGRRRAALALGLAALVAIVLALPSALSSLTFIATSRAAMENPAQVGNLLGPVPPLEALNVWLGPDYRLPRPHDSGLTVLSILLSGPLTLLGVVVALRRRWIAVWLGVVASGLALAIITWRYAIYFEAKALMALAPALGLAAAAGVHWLHRRGPRTEGLALLLGGGLAAGVLASCGYVYASAWVTPEGRFEELASLDARYAGQGPLLVNEREDYAKYLLRHVLPFESWGVWTPDRGLSADYLLDPARTPDFDDYTAPFLARFDLLLERRRPGGSRPPGNFEPIQETAHYRVWRRTSAPPVDRLPLGVGAIGGGERLDCRSQPVLAFFARARSARGRLRVAPAGRDPTVQAIDEWLGAVERRPGPAPGYVLRRGGGATSWARIERAGRYAFFVKGSHGPGVRLYVDDDPVGEAFGDLGLIDGWKPLGQATLPRGRVRLALLGLNRPAWLSGSRHPDVTGPVALVPLDDPARPPRTVTASRARALCGQRVDWMELVA